MPFVQTTTARRRPQDHSVHSFLLTEAQASIHKHRSEAAVSPGWLDIQIADVSVSFSFRARIRYLLDELQPNTAYQSARLLYHPATPAAFGREARGHPGATASHEIGFSFRGRIAAGSKFIAKPSKRWRVSRLGESYDYLSRITHRFCGLFWLRALLMRGIRLGIYFGHW